MSEAFVAAGPGLALANAHAAVDALLDVDLTLGSEDELLDSLREVERLSRRLVAVGHGRDHRRRQRQGCLVRSCDAHGLPVVSLCDTPGMRVGPDAEATAMVRHCSRLFVTGPTSPCPRAELVAAMAEQAYRDGRATNIDTW